jgi:hypothetical protein
MKIRFSALTFLLVAVLAVSACAPAVTAPDTPTVALASPTVAPSPTIESTATLIPESTVTVMPTQDIQVQPVATSRGPNLEATDPTTVSLASGGLQLVEFFRFT